MRPEPDLDQDCDMSVDPDLAEAITAMHSDLAEWIGSDAPPKVFDRFAHVLHEGFSAVTTVGQVVDRDTLLAGVWSARNLQPGLEIDITDIAGLVHGGGLSVVRFTAANRLGDVSSARRLATAVLVPGDFGYQLRTLHETNTPTTEIENPSVERIANSSRREESTG